MDITTILAIAAFIIAAILIILYLFDRKRWDATIAAFPTPAQILRLITRRTSAEQNEPVSEDLTWADWTRSLTRTPAAPAAGTPATPATPAAPAAGTPATPATPAAPAAATQAAGYFTSNAIGVVLTNDQAAFANALESATATARTLLDAAEALRP